MYKYTMATDYICVACDFKCNKKQQYDQHLLTQKHANKTNVDASVHYKCVPCEKEYNTKRGYDQHFFTQKHKNNLIDRCIRCVPCQMSVSNKSNYTKHMNTRKHMVNINKIGDSAVEQVKEDPNLIKYVMHQLHKQNEHMAELIKKVGNTTIDNSVSIDNSRKTFNLQFFLNEQCKDAINWTDFIQSITVRLEDIDLNSNITDKVTNVICKELDKLGVYKRPIHCTDIKRHKACIKDNGRWNKQQESLLKQGVTNVSGKFQQVMANWEKDHPQWHESQELSEQFVDMLNIYRRHPSDKCITTILKHSVI